MVRVRPGAAAPVRRGRFKTAERVGRRDGRPAAHRAASLDAGLGRPEKPSASGTLDALALTHWTARAATQSPSPLVNDEETITVDVAGATARIRGPSWPLSTAGGRAGVRWLANDVFAHEARAHDGNAEELRLFFEVGAEET